MRRRTTVLSWAVTAALLSGCDDTITVSDPPVTIGVLAPLTGSLQQTGEMMSQVALLAAEQINAAGGVDGIRLQILVTDVGAGNAAAAAFDELVALGAVAVIGPATQDQVVSVAPAAAASQTVFVSPISTTPWRAGGRPDDDGYMFRVVVSDELQTLAQAYFLRSLAADPPVRAVVLTESFCECGTSACSLADEDFATEQALGVFNYFECFYENPTGGAPRLISDTLLFKRGLTAADVTTTVAQLNSLDPIPDVVVLAGLEQDALLIIDAWIQAHPNAATDQQLRWVTTATTKTPGFAANMPDAVFADLGADEAPISGSAPTPPVIGRAYRSLERAYAREIGGDVADRAFAPNVWDAVHLLAAALTKQHIAGEPAGGPTLREAVRAVSSSGPILHAGQWIDLTTILRSGGDVDYDGASGPVDFDADGEVVGPYEIWQVRPVGGGYAFERTFYIDARNVPEVLATFGVDEGGTIQDLIATTCAIPPADVCP